MNIFMTNASGHVGMAVAAELAARGHVVVALARSDVSAERVRAAGAVPVRGELADPDGYLDHARRADAVVHTAFEYAADGSERTALDLLAVRRLREAVGDAGHLIYTSNGYLPELTDEAPVHALRSADPAVRARGWRLEAEREALSAPRAAVIRLGMVYGGAGGTVADLFSAADAAAGRSDGLPYLAECADNRWSLIALEDAAALYATVVERGACGVFHAVDDRPRTVREVFAAVAAACGTTATEAPEHVVRAALSAHAADIMRRDVALRAPRALSLGWSPRHPDIAAGVRAAHAQWRAGREASR